MRRIYLSGPITGVPDFLQRFRLAEMRLQAKYLEEVDRKELSIINPALVCTQLSGEYSHEEYMIVCMALMALATEIVMLPGWENSKGAQMELEAAKKSRMKVTYCKEMSDIDNV